MPILDPAAPVLGILEYPEEGEALHGVVSVTGWLLSTAPAVGAPEFRIGGRVIEGPVERVSRPDVAAAYPGLSDRNPTPGFTAVLNLHGVADGAHDLVCVARTAEGDAVELDRRAVAVHRRQGDQFYGRVWTVPPGPDRERAWWPLLRSPCCGAPLEERGTAALACAACRNAFAVERGVPLFVRPESGLPERASDWLGPASNNPYPPAVLQDLERVHAEGGVALDVGAGRRQFGAPRLVQLEISNFPFTDVVNHFDRLPFQDAAFDFVSCLAVTEHVRAPWVLAAELERVLKPGGRLHVDSAFLQPLHDFPSHFFNMSDAALAAIFPNVEPETLEPAPYQHPWFALRWILDEVLADLAPADADAVRAMSVESFVAALNDACRGRPSPLHDVSLSPDRRRDLAAGFTLRGLRRPPEA
jgi:SAM-dependent methyltransferase